MKRYVNLIPPATLTAQSTVRALRGWAVLLVALVTGALGLLVLERVRVDAATEEVLALEQRYAPLKTLLGEHREMASQAELLKNREALSLRLANDLQGAVVLGVVSQAASELPGSIYVTRLRYEQGAGDQTGAVELDGAGIDGLTVAAFAESLRHTGAFSEVSIESTSQLPGGAPALRAFKIQCAF